MRTGTSTAVRRSPAPMGSTLTRTALPSARAWRNRTRPPSTVAATVTGASARPSLSTTVSTPSGSQHQITGAAARSPLGAVTKVPAPPGARMPGPIAAMLVRTETGVSSAPVNRVRARLSRTREASAR